MNSRDLARVLVNDPYSRRTFRGVYARDTLPYLTNTRRPSAYVINTDRALGPGEHWVVVWFDGRGNSEYFDSFGFLPFRREIESFILRHCHTYRHNRRVLQNVLSSTCGLYALYYVLQKSRGASLQRVLSVFNPLKPLANDRKVVSLLQNKLRRVASSSNR